jgi:hypothetical protein
MRWAALPALIAVVLCLPCVGLAYFWDDYHFLLLGQTQPFVDFWPHSGNVFYRPIPQGLYFPLLLHPGAAGALAAHLLNLALAALAVFLLARLATKLSGHKAGLYAGVFYAAFAPLGALVAWVSAVQDLLAIVCVLLALNARQAGRPAAALAATALALFCKETVLVLLPALALWDVIAGRRPSRLAAHALSYAALALVWAAIHPGVHALIASGFSGKGTAYVGFVRPDRWGLYAVRYGATLLNFPFTGSSTPWPADRTVVGAVALALLVGGLWLTRRSWSLTSAPDARVSLPRIAVLAAFLSVPAVLLHAVMIRHWASYFAGLPGIGSALLLGAMAARAPLRAASIVMAAYLALGVWSRGASVPGGLVMTERNFVDASDAARQTEASFHRIRPTVPPGSQVLVSVASTGMLGIYQTLIANHALNFWYRDPDLVTSTAERRGAGFPAEFLFRVQQDLSVAEIDPDSCTARPSGAPVGLRDIGMPISSYARGLAASGEPERALRILDRLAAMDEEPNRSYDLRLAAMVLAHEGNPAEAQQTLAGAGPLSREEALDYLVKLYGEPTASASLDSLAFPMFGVPASDPETLRYLMKMFHIMGYRTQTVEFARRLQAVAPADSASAALIREPAPRL